MALGWELVEVSLKQHKEKPQELPELCVTTVDSLTINTVLWLRSTSLTQISMCFAKRISTIFPILQMTKPRH